MSSARHLVLLITASAACLAFAPLQIVEHREFAALQRWLAAIDQHEVGTWDAAAERIAAWPDNDLDRLVPSMETLFDLLREPGRRDTVFRKGLDELTVERIRDIARAELARGDPHRIHKRAAMLHADIMMFGPPAGACSPSTRGL